jgi:hypothetical protein
LTFLGLITRICIRKYKEAYSTYSASITHGALATERLGMEVTNGTRITGCLRPRLLLFGSDPAPTPGPNPIVVFVPQQQPQAASGGGTVLLVLAVLLMGILILFA